MSDLLATNINELIAIVTQASTRGEGVKVKDLDELGQAIATRCVARKMLVSFRGQLYVPLVDYHVTDRLREIWVSSRQQ